MQTLANLLTTSKQSHRRCPGKVGVIHFVLFHLQCDDFESFRRVAAVLKLRSMSESQLRGGSGAEFRGIPDKVKSNTVQLKWSRVEGRFNGTWRNNNDRSSKMSLRLVDNEIRGAWTTAKDAQKESGTLRLADLLWKRSSDNAAKKEEQGSADNAKQTVPDPPLAIDAEVVNGLGRNKGHVYRGLYALDGDELRLCLPDKVDLARPAKLESPPGSTLQLLRLRRVAAQQDATRRMDGEWEFVELVVDGTKVEVAGHDMKVVVQDGHLTYFFGGKDKTKFAKFRIVSLGVADALPHSYATQLRVLGPDGSRHQFNDVVESQVGLIPLPTKPWVGSPSREGIVSRGNRVARESCRSPTCRTARTGC
jgi:hypothetical protein